MPATYRVDTLQPVSDSPGEMDWAPLSGRQHEQAADAVAEADLVSGFWRVVRSEHGREEVVENGPADVRIPGPESEVQ